MQKRLKAFGKLVVSLLMVLTVLPSVSAQEVDMAALLQGINENAANFKPAAISGQLHIHMAAEEEDLFDLSMQGEGYYNIQPAFEFVMDIVGDYSLLEPVFDEEGNIEDYTVASDSGDVSLVFVDNILYTMEEGSYSAQDLSDFVAEFSDAFYAGLRQGLEMQAEVTPDLVDFYNKYFDVADSGQGYVITVKADIDPQAFIDDFSQVVDWEALKDEAVQEAINQAEAQGVEISQEEIEMISLYQDYAIQLGLSMIDHYEIHYTYDYDLAYMDIDLTMGLADLTPIIGLAGVEAIQQKFGNFQLEGGLEMSLTDIGTDFDITKPADAPLPEEVGSETGE